MSHGDIGKRNSQLLGKLLVSKLQIAAMMRECDEKSPDFFLYIDEFQHMLCPSMADILSGARKYLLHLWLANQMIEDIPDYIRRHIFNAATLIFFASDSPSDQSLIEKTLLRRVKTEEIGQLKKGETFVKMLSSVFNMTSERVPEAAPAEWTDSIIAESRAKYTADEEAPPFDKDAGPKKNTNINGTEYQYQNSRPDKPAAVPVLSPQERLFLVGVFTNPTPPLKRR